MSVSNITLSPSVGQADGHSSIRHQARQDFDELFRAMQAGNLSGAQQAYSALQQLQSGAPAASGSTSSTGTATAAPGASAGSALAADWSSLGQALQSGSLPSAQDAFSKLELDLSSASQARPHHRDIDQANAVYAAMQSVSTTTGASSAAGSGNVVSDLAALKQALQSGNTTSAQDLLAKLEQDLQASGQGMSHHHHRHSGFNTQSPSAAYSAAAATSAVSSTGSSGTTASA